MKTLKGLFSKAVTMEEPEDIIKISSIIGPLIDKVSSEIFMSHREILLKKPITYIVPAVWGARKEGELDTTQKEMNLQIAPVVDRIFESLELKDLSVSQEFAIAFLIRGYIIARIIYMIEAMNKGKVGDPPGLGSHS